MSTLENDKNLKIDKNIIRSQVTHSMTYLPEVDNIVVIKDGKISEVGTYKELLAQKGAFAEVLVQFLSQQLEETTDEDLPSELEIIRYIWQVQSVHIRKQSIFHLLKRQKRNIKLRIYHLQPLNYFP